MGTSVSRPDSLLAPYLQPGETLQWQGRPAPRCYVWRNSRHALYGMVLLIAAAAWLWGGLQLPQLWPRLLPLPVIALGLWLGPGQVLFARWQWPGVAYGVTDRRLLVCPGRGRKPLSVPREQWRYLQLRPYSDRLATVELQAGPPVQVVYLRCLEQPEVLVGVLQEQIAPDAEPVSASAADRAE